MDLEQTKLWAHLPPWEKIARMATRARDIINEAPDWKTRYRLRYLTVTAACGNSPTDRILDNFARRVFGDAPDQRAFQLGIIPAGINSAIVNAYGSLDTIHIARHIVTMILTWSNDNMSEDAMDTLKELYEETRA